MGGRRFVSPGVDAVMQKTLEAKWLSIAMVFSHNTTPNLRYHLVLQNRKAQCLKGESRRKSRVLLSHFV